MIKSYANTSSFDGGAWNPSITGYDELENEFFFELDLYAGALVNWNAFKKKFPQSINRREFFHEFRQAKKESEETAKRTK